MITKRNKNVLYYLTVQKDLFFTLLKCIKPKPIIMSIKEYLFINI